MDGEVGTTTVDIMIGLVHNISLNLTELKLS